MRTIAEKLVRVLWFRHADLNFGEINRAADAAAEAWDRAVRQIRREKMDAAGPPKRPKETDPMERALRMAVGLEPSPDERIELWFNQDEPPPVWCVLLCTRDGKQIRCLSTHKTKDSAIASANQSAAKRRIAVVERRTQYLGAESHRELVTCPECGGEATPVSKNENGARPPWLWVCGWCGWKFGKRLSRKLA